MNRRMVKICIVQQRFFSKRITRKNLSPSVLNAQYAVRGAIVIRANEIQDALKKPNHGVCSCFETPPLT